METMYFFEMDELVRLFGDNELFLSLDILDFTNNVTVNIIENKSVKTSKFYNTLEEIGKKYSCEKKINKYLKYQCEFTLKIKLEKKGVFEMSVSIKNYNS